MACYKHEYCESNKHKIILSNFYTKFHFFPRICQEKKFELYIHYCANKPRSASLIHDFLSTFFDDISNQLQTKTSLTEYLIKPVQHIMKYHAVLKDFIKYTQRAGFNTDELMKALHIMQSIPKKSDDVMNIGMLEGFKV